MTDDRTRALEEAAQLLNCYAKNKRRQKWEYEALIADELASDIRELADTRALASTPAPDDVQRLMDASTNLRDANSKAALKGYTEEADLVLLFKANGPVTQALAHFQKRQP